MKKPSLPFVVIWVIIIFGVVLMVFPRYLGPSGDKWSIKASRVEIHVISSALDKYKQDNLAYPTTEQGLKALVEKTILPPIPQDWKAPYVSDGINDCWENPYQYRCPSQHNRPDFDLWSFGPDGKDGTKDDITNWAPFPKIIKDNISDFINIIIIVVIAMILLGYLIFPWKEESKSPPLTPS